jgi:glycine/D-amino acid oxidase-like deaminating enzyme/nitrite reductase/ring-hydroxylating ferredoxin subunit
MLNRSHSLWHATTESDRRPSLEGGEFFDVAVVGAGIVGLTTAYALKNSGHSVAVIEARTILNDVTGNTTGKLTSQHGIIYRYLIDTVGQERAQQYADANEWAFREVKRISEMEGIDCDYTTDSAHVFAKDESEVDIFMDEVTAATSLGLPVRFVSDPDLPFDTFGAVRFENQARYHPLKFLVGVAEAAERDGVRIYEKSRVLEVNEGDKECEITLESGEVRARYVVIATNYPIHDSGLFVTRLAPYKSYAMAVDIDGPLPEGMFINESDPVRSFRRQPYNGKDILIVGGENHKVGQEENAQECSARLEAWARQTFSVRDVLFKWSTQDNWTPDRLPYIGRSPNRERIFLATGFGGWGMTNGICAARIISEAITEKETPWAEVYSPKRMTWAAVPKIASENVNAAKHLIGDRIKRVEEDELTAIAPGEGRVVQMEDERVGAYRDPDGALHLVTSACTHWGCQLHWNNAETTWDCPCHGSRFDIDGSVLHGPAVRPLVRRVPGEVVQVPVEDLGIEPAT